MAFGLRQGEIFARRYKVERLLASGGMGAVYEVVHLDTNRRRALKVMLPHVLQSEEMRERFKREALIAADVESEFIVDVFDAGVDEETQMPFMVMELLRGEDLGKRIKLTGRLDAAEALGFLHQTALALDRMHRKSLVHRDLKPENIFLAQREDGPPRVKLLDFGVAKVLGQGTAAGGTEVVGTPSYMAPEQFRSSPRITSATDVYAFGLTAYTLLVGAPYWYDETASGNAFAIALVAARGPEEPASVRAARRGADLPPGFDAWFATMTAVDPAQRYVTATAAVRALALLFGLGLPASSLDMPRPATDPPSSSALGPPAPTTPMPPPDPPVPTVGLPSYSATVRQPRSRPALLAIAMLAIGGGIAALAFSGRAPPASGVAPTASAPPEPPAASVTTDAGTALTASEAVASARPPPAAATAATVGKPPAQNPTRAAAPVKSAPRSRPTPVYSQE
jgi:serine/threonine-protein kinase